MDELQKAWGKFESVVMANVQPLLLKMEENGFNIDPADPILKDQLPKVLFAVVLGLLMICLFKCCAGRKKQVEPLLKEDNNPQVPERVPSAVREPSPVPDPPTEPEPQVDDGSNNDDPVQAKKQVEPLLKEDNNPQVPERVPSAVREPSPVPDPPTEPEPQVDDGSNNDDPVQPNDVFDGMAEASEIFKTIDRNGDGTVTLKELRDAVFYNRKIKKALRLKNSKDARSFFGEADVDESKSLTFEEFLATCRFKSIVVSSVTKDKEATDEKIKQAFEGIDKNKDGKLDKTEFKAAYAGMLIAKGETPTVEKIKDWTKKAFKKYDDDKSGELDFDEFYKFCQNNPSLLS